jgi:hypothetical protein
MSNDYFTEWQMIILQSVRKILQYCKKNLTVGNSKMQEKQVLQRMTISFSVYVFIGDEI